MEEDSREVIVTGVRVNSKKWIVRSNVKNKCQKQSFLAECFEKHLKDDLANCILISSWLFVLP